MPAKHCERSNALLVDLTDLSHGDKSVNLLSCFNPRHLDSDRLSRLNRLGHRVVHLIECIYVNACADRFLLVVEEDVRVESGLSHKLVGIASKLIDLRLLFLLSERQILFR